jgi:hypothetical protein
MIAHKYILLSTEEMSTKSDLANQLGINDSAAGSGCTCMSARM